MTSYNKEHQLASVQIDGDKLLRVLAAKLEIQIYASFGPSLDSRYVLHAVTSARAPD